MSDIYRLRKQVIKGIINRHDDNVMNEATPPSKSGSAGTSLGGTKTGGGSATYTDAIAGLEGDTGIVVRPYDKGLSPTQMDIARRVSQEQQKRYWEDFLRWVQSQQ